MYDFFSATTHDDLILQHKRLLYGLCHSTTKFSELIGVIFFPHWCCVSYYLFKQLHRILESFDKFQLILHICPWMIKVLSILVEISFFQFFSWIHGAYDSFLENIQFPCSECNCGSAALARRTLESCSTHSGRAHWCLWLHWFPRSPY